MYLEGIHMYMNVFLMVDRCILKDTKVFECFLNFLDVFIVYFILLVVYLNVIQCIYSILQCILMCLKAFECLYCVFIIHFNVFRMYL
jgi:hypothetical protein